MTPAVEAVDLYRFFHAGDEETLALRGVSLRVDPGELVTVTGPSGSGKSTLLACMAGLDDPDGGVVRIAGERISRRPEPERARLRAGRVGFLHQSGNLLGHLSVAGNVALVRGLPGGRPPDDAAEVLERVGIAHRARALPTQLSGGELARAGLAVALANAPSVLLADEPTGELDSDTGERIMRLLRGLADGGAAVAVVTHRADAEPFADRAVAMADGRLV